MKNRSHRYDISKPRSRREYNYCKYKVSHCGVNADMY